MHRRPLTIAALLLAGTALLGACGDDDDSSPVAEGARRIEVSATIEGFDPDEIEAEVGEDLAIALTSDDMLHDFTIDELDAHVVADRGDTAEGGVTVDEAGTYDYECRLHSSTMRGKVVVT